MTVREIDGPIVVLDDCRKEGAGPSYVFQSPAEIICAESLQEVPGALARLDAVVADGYYAAGWISYEVASAFEPTVANGQIRRAEEPLIWLMVTRDRTRLDGTEGSALWRRYTSSATSFHFQFDGAGMSEGEYAEQFYRIKDYIIAGDVYQVNYTFPRACTLRGDARGLYAALRQKQPVAFGAYIDTGVDGRGHRVLSLSPELFLRRKGEAIETHPMKGTARKVEEIDPAAKAANQSALTMLARDEKTRAENLMIVDLIRNDLSRIAQPGSVSVKDLFHIEEYPTVYQMTSKVQAECKPCLQPSEILRAIFPCGSVTGAPKVRAMQIINELEPEARGVYCGAIGFFGPANQTDCSNDDVDWVLNVPIRTLIFDSRGQGRVHVGGGIVADSTVSAEYDECQAKLSFAKSVSLETDFHLIETMRCERGTLAYLQYHLRRMEASARYFNMPWSGDAIRAALHAYCQEYSNGVHRVRLGYYPDGTIDVTGSPLASDPSASPLQVAFAEEVVNHSSVFLRHKTSVRTLYNRATKRANEIGLADILFLNQKGTVAEGAISTVFLKVGDSYLTPPVADGALPGILRETMFANHKIPVVEKSLLMSDVLMADHVYIGNALRGLRRVQVIADRVSLRGEDAT